MTGAIASQWIGADRTAVLKIFEDDKVRSL